VSGNAPCCRPAEDRVPRAAMKALLVSIPAWAVIGVVLWSVLRAVA
jgi:hypothetical protein